MAFIRPWMNDEMEILRTMLDAGKTLEDISKVLKSRNIDSIRSKSISLGYKPSLHPRGEIDMEAFRRIMKGVK